MRLEHPVARNLVAILPPLLYIQASDEPRASWMQSVLGLMAVEARRSGPAARTGWLGALQDPQIGRALALIHRDPARAWTLASPARELAMSRSTFAARFSQLVDEPAMQYLTRWWMQLTQHALQTEGATVAEVAGRLGYHSEAAFARAFKRVIGVPPGAGKRAGDPQLAAPLAVATAS